MLPRRQKLTRLSFPAHNEPKQTFRGIFLVFRITRTKDVMPPRFAVVVPKKVCNLATRRSKLRRMLYREIVLHKAGFAQLSGAKIVVTAQKTTAEATVEQIHSEVESFFVQFAK